jgi:hypothetical protein
MKVAGLEDRKRSLIPTWPGKSLASNTICLRRLVDGIKTGIDSSIKTRFGQTASQSGRGEKQEHG